MKFTHRFTLQASLDCTASFHADPDSMAAITPPPIVVRMQSSPARLEEGAEMTFTLWLGLLPVRWVARIEDVSATGFTDRQIRGPFRTWVHRHTFLPLSEDRTEVRDEIQVALRFHPVWGPVGLGMWLGLKILFAYRAWKTRRLVEKRQ